MELTRTSASQVKDYDGCPRLWFFKNVLRRRPPQTDAQSRGTAIHSALEGYLKVGKVEDQLPAPGVTVEEFKEYVEVIKPHYEARAGTVVGKGLVEHKDEMATYEGGPKFVLIIDHAREVKVAGTVIPQIDDLKTLSDFRYVKTPDELAKDPQMVSYAEWAIRQYEEENEPPPDFVSIRHVYVRTRGKKISTERSRLMPPVEVREQWAKIIEKIRSMQKLAAEVTDPMAVLPNTSHCSAYGGCFFRPDCHGAPPKSIAEAFEKEQRKSEDERSQNMSPQNGQPSLLARLKAQQGGAGAAAPAAAAPTVATELPRVASANGVAQSGAHGGSRLRSVPPPAVAPAPAAQAAPAAPATPATPAAPATGGGRLARLRGGAAAAPVASVAAPEVLPPDAPPRETAAENVPPAEAPKTEGDKPAKGRKRGGRMTIDTSAIDGTAPAAPAPVAPAAPAVPAPETFPSGFETPTVAAVCKLEELYIDCMPIKGGGQHGLAEEILARAGADIVADTPKFDPSLKDNVHDWRMISYTSRGVLAQAIRARLGEIPPVLVISSSLSGSDVLIETLAPIARKVVRALRG
jgi:PD-(D/E)XK nuclease superfamily protein